MNGDAFRSVCDHVFWHDASPAENPGFRNGDVVFCKIDEVWRLFRALRRTRKRIVLVTGEGDKPVSPGLWKQKPVHVAEWFGTNMQLFSHRFVLCPPGHGEDTHRMWEARYCGAVPVVRKSPAMRAFGDLPIIFVEVMPALTV